MKQVDADSRSTMTFEWGSLKWYVQPDTVEGATLSFGEVVVNPGRGHDRHKHDTAEEVLYVLSGAGRQTLDDSEAFDIRPGDVVYVPQGMWHSTWNTAWSPLRLIALYNPGGEEERILASLPDHREVAPGDVPTFVRPADVR